MVLLLLLLLLELVEFSMLLVLEELGLELVLEAIRHAWAIFDGYDPPVAGLFVVDEEEASKSLELRFLLDNSLAELSIFPPTAPPIAVVAVAPDEPPNEPPKMEAPLFPIIMPRFCNAIRCARSNSTKLSGNISNPSAGRLQCGQFLMNILSYPDEPGALELEVEQVPLFDACCCEEAVLARVVRSMHRAW